MDEQQQHAGESRLSEELIAGGMWRDDEVEFDAIFILWHDVYSCSYYNTPWVSYIMQWSMTTSDDDDGTLLPLRIAILLYIPLYYDILGTVNSKLMFLQNMMSMCQGLWRIDIVYCRPRIIFGGIQG